MVKLKVLDAAKETDAFFHLTENEELVSATKTVLTIRSEVIEGPHAGKISKAEFLGRFDVDKQTGVVDAVRESVGGKAHFLLTLDGPVDLFDLLTDPDTALGGPIDFTGNRFANSFEAGTDDDRLDGRDGDDVLRGVRGDDRIFGERGNDRLHGGRGNDTVKGGNGADLLSDLNGRNEFDGGKGDDTLEAGGDGRDLLTGGEGRDRFVFSEGGVRSKKSDAITDFDPDRDRIEILASYSAAGDDPDLDYVFIGEAAFSGGAGQLRWAGSALLGDADGDGRGDFRIHLLNEPEITSGDFLV